MSSSYAEPLARLEACLDEIAAVNPTFRTPTEKQQALLELSRVINRAQAERLRVLATADDIAELTGDKSAAAWLSTQTRDNHGVVRREASLAAALDERWSLVASGLQTGDLNLAQARVLVEALDTLPSDLGDDLRVKAEAHLVGEAAHHGPRELRVLGAKILSVIAPDIADEAEYQQLLAAEQEASAATRLSVRRRGDGSTDVRARIPDHAAGRLLTFLNAFTAPRRRHLDTPFGKLQEADTARDEFANLPLDRQRGIAFTALLANTPASSLPQHGGAATTLMVTIDHQTLLADLEDAGVALTSTGETITAALARHLACQAGILPMVLGNKSEILDLGRESRLYKPYQRKAINARDKTCTETNCTVPAEFCEAHHPIPWSEGGTTDVNTGKLLCPFHHDRAHDVRWETHHHPDGSTSFTRVS